MDIEALVKEAMRISQNSYAPYSQFRVGAALLCEDGTIVSGVNVENRSYGLTICAERSAIATAVATGHKRFQAIAIYSPDSDYPIPPCGACRQVLSEFLPPTAPVIFTDRNGNREDHTVAEILPYDSLQELKHE